MNSKIPLLALLPALLLAPLITPSHAQENNGRIPVYPVPYTYPTVEGVSEVLDRVRVYYESTGPLAIIDAETGKEVTDFSKPNAHARVADGFASEWTYTHGVVLSAFDYIDEVTGDERFFDNNTRFFDFVVEHLPYFREQARLFGQKEKIPAWNRILEFHALDDCGSIGAAMIKTYRKNGNEDYLALIERVDEHVSNNQFRLQDGTLARHRPQYESVWTATRRLDTSKNAHS